MRPHPAPRGAAPRLQVELHDLRLGRPGQGREGDRGGGGLGPEALRPARHPLPDLEREEPARQPGGVRAPRRLLLRADRRRRVRPLPAAPARVERDGLRRPDHADGRGARALPGGPREVAEGLPLRPRGRVPGHEPRAVPAPAAARRRARQRLRGRRSRPVDLRVPRRRHPQHPRVRARLRRRPDDRSGAELPLDQRDPARGQLRDRQQPRAQAEEPLQRSRRRRSCPRDRGGGRARRGALRRRRDRRPGGRGSGRLRDRRLLPHQRAVAGAGGRARPPGDPVPGDRRPALLRARRDQGRGRLPPGHRQPLRRRLARPHRQPPAPRHRRRVDRPHPGLRGRAGHLALRGARPGRRRRRGRCAAQGRAALPHAHAVPDGGRARATGARAAGEGPRAHRLRRGARGRADGRGAGPPGEPDGARRRRPRVPGGFRRADALGVPPADLPLLRPGRARRGAEPRHAHDAAQRQGPRVSGGVPRRHGGRRLPARALARGAGARGGAPARLRRPHACAGAPDAHPCGDPFALGLAGLPAAEPVPGGASAGRGRARAAATTTSWSGYGAPRQSLAPSTGTAPDLSTGDNVRHSTLGEGVVVRIEGDGTVTVRFAQDGAERRLMLDYAPLEKVL